MLFIIKYNVRVLFKLLFFSLETSLHSTYLSVIRLPNQTELQLSQQKHLVYNNQQLEAHPLHTEHRLLTNTFTSNITQHGNHSEIVLVEVSDKSTTVEMFIGDDEENLVTFDMGRLNLFLLRLNPKQTVWLKTSTRNATIKTLQLSSSLSSFSAIFNRTFNFTVPNNQYSRVDGWSSRISPLFDQSQGYREGSGMYVAPSNGFYHIDISILSSTSQKR